MSDSLPFLHATTQFLLTLLEYKCLKLKALINNVFTFKNLSCISLYKHAISVFDKVYKVMKHEKNCTSKAPLTFKCFKEVKLDK